MGNRAGANNQNNNTIVLNATGVALNTTPPEEVGQFFVKPIRQEPDEGCSRLWYGMKLQEKFVGVVLNLDMYSEPTGP